MAKILNIEGLSAAEINNELSNGAKFVVFPYCISIIVMTFKRSSDIYFIKSSDSALKHGYGFILLSFFFGWWGIPWGPIYTIGSLYSNLTGGKDVSAAVLNSIHSK